LRRSLLEAIDAGVPPVIGVFFDLNGGIMNTQPYKARLVTERCGLHFDHPSQCRRSFIAAVRPDFLAEYGKITEFLYADKERFIREVQPVPGAVRAINELRKLRIPTPYKSIEITFAPMALTTRTEKELATVMPWEEHWGFNLPLVDRYATNHEPKPDFLARNHIPDGYLDIIVLDDEAKKIVDIRALQRFILGPIPSALFRVQGCTYISDYFPKKEESFVDRVRATVEQRYI
jgi:hypothetical protein